VDVTPFLYYLRVPADRRDPLRAYLSEHGIDTGIHWQPGHWFSLLKNCRRGDLAVTDRVGAEVLSLPMHSMMPMETVDIVCDRIAAFFAGK
jgi:dTDP-4-amino-4,6-dideoxygalactose transaminase